MREKNEMRILFFILIILSVTLSAESEKKSFYGFSLGEKIVMTKDLRKITKNNIIKFCKKDKTNMFDTICAIVDKNNIVENIRLQKNGSQVELFKQLVYELKKKYNIKCDPFFSWGSLAGYKCYGFNKNGIKVNIFIQSDYMVPGTTLMNNYPDYLAVSFSEYKPIN